MRLLAAILVASLLAGCVLFPSDDPPSPDDLPPGVTPDPASPPLRFGGIVRDTRGNETLPEASVRLDLAQALPCGRQGVGWSSWDLPVTNGSFGPFTVARPRSNDVAFFVHATAPGYAENTTFIGPTQARGDLGNLSIRLHPDARVEGTAPAGTILALDAPVFPRVTIADASGTFRFEHARANDALLVAATDVPFRTFVRAPATVTVPAVEARGWTLEGIVKGPTGAPVAADVVAWNGTQMVSVGRSAAGGAFVLPLPPEPVGLRIEARTADNALGGTLQIEVAGPPALRETILVKALC